LERVASETHQDAATVQKMYDSERINPELVAYIDQLHEKYKTALLTNASASFINPLIEKIGLKKVFDQVVVSSEIGIIKPDPRIYEYTLKLLGVEPSESVFVDDSQARVNGAAAVGMQAILYKNFAQLKVELEKVLAAATDD
jgi:putative hydrolase of the HAD superfamily